MSFAVGVRQTCRRSFATTTRLQSESSIMSDVVKVLDHRSEEQQKLQDRQAAKSASTIHYQSFHADQFLNPSSLSYKACTRSRPSTKQLNVAPTPSVARQNDIFHQLDLDPRVFTNNPAILYDFVTEMGKIKSRKQTLLTVKSQRLLGRTIRRAKMMGIVPTLSK